MELKMKKIKGLYIVEFENGIKIGISNNVHERLESYKKPWCRPIVNSFIVECQCPIQLELRIKKQFKKSITYNESTEFITGVTVDIIKAYAENHKESRPSGTYIDPAKRSVYRYR